MDQKVSLAANLHLCFANVTMFLFLIDTKLLNVPLNKTVRALCIFVCDYTQKRNEIFVKYNACLNH